ncbi:MAG TPA: efflux RND transporter periplasmic adaptor subunit, partial [Bacteroidota bacterium]|nr:efflux RND transporter periplasmic adaptor subunit [Bacteroidota bacterium]
MKKLYLYSIIGVVLLLGTGGYFWLSNSGGKDIKYRTEKASRGSVVVNVRATGTINPVQTVQVGSQVSGLLAKIFVDFNSEVKKGQVIAIIDSTFLYAAVNQAQANLERNQAQLNQAKRDYERTKLLSDKQLVSQADLDAATATYEGSKAQMKQTEAALDQAKVNLRYAVIRAPIDGVVISRDVDVGQTVAASLQAPKLFEIANDLSQMQVEASVDEADIGQLKVGQSVTFSVDAYPEEQFRGNVSQVRLSPITVQNVVTYTVIIQVPNPDMKLRPGMTATVSVLVDKRDNVLRVPVLATRFQPPADVLDKAREERSAAGDSSGRQQGQGQGMQQRGDRQGWQSAAGDSSRRRWQGMDSTQRREMRERFRNGQGGQMGGNRQGQWSGQEAGDNQRRMSHVWILDENRNPKMISITNVLIDNRYVEVFEDGLKEGDDVIIGTIGGETAGASQQ